MEEKPSDVLPGAHVEPEEATRAQTVVAHAHDHAPDTALLRRRLSERPHASRHPHHHQDPVAHFLSLNPRLPVFVQSVGTGFLYGTLFGGVLAVVEGYRESPQHQRLRGILHHGKHVIPATAGRIAVVTALFRAASWALDTARGHRKADIVTVLLAAPVAGAMLRIRHGPKAAMRTAVSFGTIGAVMVMANVAQAKVARRHRDSPSEVLEEIAFAEEIDDIEVEIDDMDVDVDADVDVDVDVDVDLDVDMDMDLDGDLDVDDLDVDPGLDDLDMDDVNLDFDTDNLDVF